MKTTKLYRVSDPAGPENVEAANADAAFLAVHGMRTQDVTCATDLNYADPAPVDMLDVSEDYLILRFEPAEPGGDHLEVEAELLADFEMRAQAARNAPDYMLTDEPDDPTFHELTGGKYVTEADRTRDMGTSMERNGKWPADRTGNIDGEPWTLMYVGDGNWQPRFGAEFGGSDQLFRLMANGDFVKTETGQPR